MGFSFYTSNAYTTAQANENKWDSPETDPADSNLSTSIGTTDSDNSDLIDLNQTFRANNTNVNRALTDMVKTLSFGEAVKLIPSFPEGSEGTYTTLELRCVFIIKNIDGVLKGTIFEAIQSNITDRASYKV